MTIFKIAYPNDLYKYLFSSCAVAESFISEKTVKIQLKFNSLNTNCDTESALKVMLEDLKNNRTKHMGFYYHIYYHIFNITECYLNSKLTGYTVYKDFIIADFSFDNLVKYKDQEAKDMFDSIK